MKEEVARQLKELDEAKVSKLHWKILFVSGIGFFTDAYDLFIIGVAMAMIGPEWHPAPLQVSLVTSTALLASAIGALWFGRVADMLGRKRIYGFECLVLAAGAIATAFSPNITWLIIFRIILGLGIGGDYPVSATMMSEYSGKSSRGLLVGLVFAMQAAGLIFGPLFAAGLLISGLPHPVVWRILLAFGAVPALLVFYWRRTIKETPRFVMAQREATHQEGESGRSASGSGETESSEASDRPRSSFQEGFRRLLANKRWRTWLFGASAAWFLVDFAYYGNTVSSPMILKAIAPHQDLLTHILLQLIVFVVAAAPGYLVAALTMDRLGRKTIQAVGFGAMAISFAGIALVPDIDKLIVPFFILFGLSYFFTEFGPNATTFVYPAELFPVDCRTTGHGIASATGKLGAFVGVFLFPLLMHWHGLLAAELAASIVSLLGVFVTLLLLPETKGRSLEEITGETVSDAATMASRSA